MLQSSPWRLILSPPLDGATNMALDHALARSAGAGTGPPTLRFYRWQPDCLSLGYFQRLERDVDQAACAAAGIEIVRRPTGGRAILHAAEVTYALAARVGEIERLGDPHPRPLSRARERGGRAADGVRAPGRRILDSYRTISTALLAGLQQLGVAASWATVAATEHSAACFDAPGDYEITFDGRKLLGSAQTRTSSAILQHGTLLLAADVPLLHSLLHLPPTLTPAALAGRLIALDEIMSTPVEWETVVAALIAGFQQAWKIDLEPGEPTAQEWELTAQLRQQRYANPAWTARR